MRTREELQKEAIDALLCDRRLIVNWGTGVGKSRVAIGAADRLARCGKKRFLLLVAETAHKSNWEREFREALGVERGENLFSMMTVECYASLSKYEWTAWDLIIADEAHHLRSESRTDSISTVRTDYFLCLSATMSCKGDADDLLRMLEVANGPFKSLDFTTQNAIDNKILGEPKIFVHILNIDDFKKKQEIVEEWGLSKKRVTISCDYEDRKKYYNRELYPAVTLTISATPKQAYEYYTEKMTQTKNKWELLRHEAGLKDGEPDNEASAWVWNKYVNYGSQRKVVVGKSKTTFSRWLLSRLADRKYVCFCADVEQGKELGGDNVIYAGKKDNISVIESFNAGTIRSLFAVNMIQEGQNLTGIQAGVIIQLGGKERQFVQKFGRALRARLPEQHIVVVAGTRDEAYYRIAVEGLNPKYIIKKYYGTAGKRKEHSVAGDVNLPGLTRSVNV